MIPIVRGGLRQHEVCFDETAPFNTTHVGKIVLGGVDTGNSDTPRNHRVVNSLETGGPALVRFTEYRSTMLGEVAETPEAAADVHALHLRKLDEIGLAPWYKAVQGVSSLPDMSRNGIYVLQDLLPEGTTPLKVGTPQHEAFDAMQQVYTDWAVTSGQPVLLYDITTADQASVLPDNSVVLHDIEPRYRTVAQHQMMQEYLRNL